MEYVNVPADVFRAALPLTAKSVYAFLASCCQPGKNRLSTSQVKLARDLGIQRVTLRKYLQILVESGWLSLEERGRTTTIVLRNPVFEQRQEEAEQARKRLARAEHKGEALMREWLNLLVASEDYDDNARPGFLRNPLTGEPMEYDRWYPVGVAFEFNGPQHYGPTETFPDPEKVRLTISRDYMKKGISHDKGVRLVVVHPEDLSLAGMRKKVEGLLPLRQISPHDPVLRLLSEASLAYTGKVHSARRRSFRAQSALQPGPPREPSIGQVTAEEDVIALQ